MATIDAFKMAVAPNGGGHRVFKKAPTDVVKIEMDWSQVLETNSEISGTPTWTVQTGLTKDLQANTTTATLVLLSSGTAGTDYLVECSITDGTLTYRRGFTVQVRSPVV